MNIISRLRFISAARSAAMALALAGAPVTHATLLVYEGFNGYTAGQLVGQTPNGNTVGLNQSVGYYDDGVITTRALNYTLQTTGLTFGSLATSGAALKFTAGTNVIGADISIGTAFTGTLWSSYLVQLSAQSAGAVGDGAVIRIGDKPSDSPGSHFNSWADARTSVSASTNVSVGYGTTPLTTANGSASLSQNTTYIIIHKFTRVGQSLSVGSPGVSTLWALTAAQYAAFLSAGGTEAALISASVTATATNSQTSGTFSFSSNDSFAIVTVNDTGVYDELRFGSALADVIPAAAIPEPATTALLLAAGCGAFVFTRRRRV